VDRQSTPKPTPPPLPNPTPHKIKSLFMTQGGGQTVKRVTGMGPPAPPQPHPPPLPIPTRCTLKQQLKNFTLIIKIFKKQTNIVSLIKNIRFAVQNAVLPLR